MADVTDYFNGMKTANIVQFKEHLGKYLSLVEQGEKIQLCRRNVPVAMIIPSGQEISVNTTCLGCGKDSVQIKTDLTESVFSPDEWAMLQGKM